MAFRNSALSSGLIWYSTVTGTGLRSDSTSSNNTTGSGQCMDGVRSSVAAVWSFHHRNNGSPPVTKISPTPRALASLTICRTRSGPSARCSICARLAQKRAVSMRI